MRIQRSVVQDQCSGRVACFVPLRALDRLCPAFQRGDAPFELADFVPQFGYVLEAAGSGSQGLFELADFVHQYTDPDVLVTYAVQDGYLGSAAESNPPAAFELRTPEADRLSFRVAYLEAPGLNLTKYVGKHVRIVGTQRWHKGDRYPVISVERIDMVW